MELKPVSLISRLALLLAVLSLLAFIPTEDTPLDKLVSALQKWSDTTAHEKVYLHTDRPYYAIGDTIWFKGYVTIGSKHQLSAKSGALYVELINSADSVTQLLKLPVLSGMAKGCFVLAKPLLEGNYRIRSYTQWMRNAGPDYYYDRMLLIKGAALQNVFTNVTYQYPKAGEKRPLTAIINYTDSTGTPFRNMHVKFNLRKNYNTLYSGEGLTDVRGSISVSLSDFNEKQLLGASMVTRADLPNFEVATKSFPIKSISSQADVQFLPEGGNMVQNYGSRVAFKATGTDGLGIDIKGIVTDDANETITTFSSKHLGMGYLSFMPKPNHTYKATITYADGSTGEFKLPPAQARGYVLSAYPNVLNDSVLVRISGIAPPNQTSNTVHVILQSGGEVYYSASIDVKDGRTGLHISLADMPSGVAQLSLFSASGIPMNERVFFVDNKDRITLDIKADKNTYGPRDRAIFTMAATNAGGKPVVGNFSVSVINEDDVPYDDDKGSSILSHLLLCSDIKGYVEQPNYYFNHQDTNVKDELDALMLTQGYRRFSWTDLAANKPYNLRYSAEGLATSISGKLLGLWDRRIPYGKIYIQNSMLHLFVDTVTDKYGNFNFDRLIVTDSLRFTVAGRRKNNQPNVHIFVSQPPKQPVICNANIGDIITDFRKVIKPELGALSKEEEAHLLKAMPKSTLLKEVNINRRAGTPSLQVIKGQISQSIIFDESDAGKKIMKALKGKNVPGLKINNFLDSWFFYFDKEAMSTYVNDQQLSGPPLTEVMNWKVENIEKIDIVKSNKLTKPAIFFYTNTVYKPAIGDGGFELVWDITNFSPKGFNHVKEFYEPKYGYATRALQIKDLRTTVYWNPSVVTRDGHASFSFYNNDKPGNYKVVVEGIDADGELGRQVYRYKVGMNL